MFASRTNWRLESNALALAVQRHRQSARPVFDLTASNPTVCGFRYPHQEILSALSDPRALLYSPDPKGLFQARAAVAAYYRGHSGFFARRQEIDPHRVILLSGTSEAYSHIFRLLCEPGDEILVPAPSYPLFEYLADLNDIRLVCYPLLYDHGWQIDFHSLTAALTTRSRAVLLVHPNNPAGCLVNSKAAVQLAELCAARSLAIVSDEVFLDYPAPGIDPPASFAFDGPALTFTLSGLSKICALPQMKLAWTVVSGPESLAGAALARLEIIADTYLSPGAPVQLAAPALLSLRGGIQRQLQQRIAANEQFLDRELQQAAAPVTRLARQAGWYAVLRVPSSLPDESLAVQLLGQTSVLLHPGCFFNFAQNGFLVASLIVPEEEFQQGCRRLTRFFGSLR